MLLAVQAMAAMYADDAAARLAGPSVGLLLQKRIHAARFDMGQVLDHAHCVFCTVSFVELFQSGAWICIA